MTASFLIRAAVVLLGAAALVLLGLGAGLIVGEPMAWLRLPTQAIWAVLAGFLTWRYLRGARPNHPADGLAVLLIALVAAGLYARALSAAAYPLYVLPMFAVAPFLLWGHRAQRSAA